MRVRPSGTAGEEQELSPECTLASRPGYEDIHASCRRLRDIPLPHGGGLLLVRRCGCACHNRSEDGAQEGIADMMPSERASNARG